MCAGWLRGGFLDELAIENVAVLVVVREYIQLEGSQMAWDIDGLVPILEV